MAGSISELPNGQAGAVGQIVIGSREHGVGSRVGLTDQGNRSREVREDREMSRSRGDRVSGERRVCGGKRVGL